MMDRRHFLRLLALSLLLCSCAPTGRVQEPEPEPLTGWRVTAPEYIALWYHGLAYLSTDTRTDSIVIPRFAPGYVDRIVALKRREGVYPTPLDERAPEFSRIFRSDAVYEGLQFLPLYFRDAEALYSGIDLWNRVGGNPPGAGSPEAAQVVGFLSQLFPRPTERQMVVEWVRLIQEEDSAFYRAYWAGQAATLDSRAAAVQREWDSIRPALAQYLEYTRSTRGELYLTPALDAEGRTVLGQTGVPRVAVLEPEAVEPAHAIWVLIHELLYPLVGDVIRENVAPVQIRELGEERLSSIAAVRGGAILLSRTAPRRVDDYQRFYLAAAGHTPPPTSGALETAFDTAFPLSPQLVKGLETAIDNALAGI
jgi:hypothetical protein